MREETQGENQGGGPKWRTHRTLAAFPCSPLFLRRHVKFRCQSRSFRLACFAAQVEVLPDEGARGLEGAQPFYVKTLSLPSSMVEG